MAAGGIPGEQGLYFFYNVEGRNTVVEKTNCIMDLIEEFRSFHDGLPALFAFCFRLPNLELTHCFYYTLFFYTPEKPGCQSAFRVSTYSWA